MSSVSGVDRPGLEAWIALYVRAWRTPGTELLGDLFESESTYLTAPFEEPYHGLAAIAELWEREREGPEEVFTLTSEVIAVEGETGVARVHVRYGEPVSQEWADLWIVRFDRGGRCAAFEEWPFSPRTGSGAGTG